MKFVQKKKKLPIFWDTKNLEYKRDIQLKLDSIKQILKQTKEKIHTNWAVFKGCIKTWKRLLVPSNPIKVDHLVEFVMEHLLNTYVWTRLRFHNEFNALLCTILRLLLKLFSRVLARHSHYENVLISIYVLPSNLRAFNRNHCTFAVVPAVRIFAVQIAFLNKLPTSEICGILFTYIVSLFLFFF